MSDQRNQSNRFLSISAIVIAFIALGLQLKESIGVSSVITRRLSIQDSTDSTKMKLWVNDNDPTITAYLKDGNTAELRFKHIGDSVAFEVYMNGALVRTIQTSP